MNRILLTLVSLLFFKGSFAAVPFEEREALVQLYFSTNGDNWVDNSGWLTGDPCDNGWYGVNCFNGEIYWLALSNNQLNGTIPPEIGDLPNLQYLFLDNNELQGPIPSEIGQLTNLLWVYLYTNELSGTIPASLSNLTNLERLSLNQNNLSGPIPASIGTLTNLIDLNLSQNALEGPVPSELGGLSNLTGLLLWGNQLTGTIPSTLGNLGALELLSLSRNELTGQIPSNLGNLGQLQQLLLNNNNLIGGIPTSIGNLVQLTVLDLFSNQLSGAIPGEIGNLTQLTSLFMSVNEFSGEIPSAIGNLTQLSDMSLSRNRLSGQIPPEMGNLTQLDGLYLYSNRLSGDVPSTLSSLVSTPVFDLRFNALTSSDSSLNGFINNRPCDPQRAFCSEDWQFTQTQAPDGIQVISASGDSVSLAWDEASYQAAGRYQVLMSENIAGPYTLVHETSSKNEIIHTLAGLNPTTEYFFRLNTGTDPHAFNQSLVISGDSPAIAATTGATSTTTNLSIQFTALDSAASDGHVINGIELVDVSYSLQILNDSSESLMGSFFVHLQPDELESSSWTCGGEENGAVCPTANGTGNIITSLDLPPNSNLTYTVDGQIAETAIDLLEIVASIAPPNGYSDGDLAGNTVSVNFTSYDALYADRFE